MRAPAAPLLSPPAPFLVSLISMAVLGGCATRFESGPFHPVPQAMAGPGLPYAQVREYGLASPVHWIWLSFAETRPRQNAAVTLDVRNDTAAPLLLELSRARLRHVAPGKITEMAVLSAGFGNIPRSVDLDAPGEPALELAPGATRTIWLAFAPPPKPEPGDAPGRLLVVVPVTAAGDVVVAIHDEVASPEWTRKVTSAIGLYAGVGTRLFDSSRGRFNHVEASLFHTRGAFTGALVGGVFTLHERLRGGIAHAGGPSLGLDLAWRPLASAVGIFVAGHHQWIDFDTGSGEPDRRLFGATVGLNFPLQAGVAPPAALRVGYSHLFGDRTPYHGGLFAALEVRLLSN